MARRTGLCQRGALWRSGGPGRNAARQLDRPLHATRARAHLPRESAFPARMAPASLGPPVGAMEMPRSWTAQTAAHQRLESSHRPRDSHISTALVCRATDVYAAAGAQKVLPMYPVYFVTYVSGCTPQHPSTPAPPAPGVLF